MKGFWEAKARAVSRARPLSVQLELTYVCNWRCAFCYNTSHRDSYRMSLDDWRPVLEDLEQLGALTICLTGGEPLCHPEFFEIAAAVRARGLALKVFTNGTLVSHEAALRLASLKPVSVDLSLHGSSEATHDLTTGREGSFRGLMTGVRRLQDAGVRVILKSLITRLNEHEIDEIVDFARGLGCRLQIDTMITPVDSGDMSPLSYSCSESGIRRVMEVLKADGQLHANERVRGGVNCGLGTTTMAIDPQGNVFPCIQWRASSLGNVRMARLKDLWFGAARKEAAQIAKQTNDCLVDAGGPLSRFSFCPALALQVTGSLEFPDAAALTRARIAEELRWTAPESS